jgi:hypothetical protein
MLFADLVEGATREGLRVWLKMDGPRFADERPPWTVVLNHPDLGVSGSLRGGDYHHFHQVIGFIRGHAGMLPGDWSWLGDHVDPGELPEIFERLGRAGLLVILTYDGSWNLAVNGPNVGSFPTLEDCLISANALT